MKRRVDELTGRIDELNCRKSTKTTPGAPKNDPKTTPKRPKKRSRRIRRKKDRTKTIPRPSWTAHGPICVPQRRPPGSIWEPITIQNRSKNDQKSKRKIKRQKNQSKTILDPFWSDLGSFWGAILGEETPETVYFKRFREQSLFRR